MKYRLFFLLFTLLTFSSFCSTASADITFEYFSWTETSTDNYAATAFGIDATLNFSTFDADTGNPVPRNATNPEFISKYGASVPAFTMSNGVGGTQALGLSSITFSQALPANSILIAFDVDTIRFDEFRFSNTQNPLTFVEQLELVENENSDFPIWNQAAQSLISNGVQGNNSEATVLNVEGNSTLNVSFLREAGGSSFGVSIFAIGVAVPEPTGCFPLVVLAVAISARRKRD